MKGTRSTSRRWWTSGWEASSTSRSRGTARGCFTWPCQPTVRVMGLFFTPSDYVHPVWWGHAAVLQLYLYPGFIWVHVHKTAVQIVCSRNQAVHKMAPKKEVLFQSHLIVFTGCVLLLTPYRLGGLPSLLGSSPRHPGQEGPHPGHARCWAGQRYHNVTAGPEQCWSETPRRRGQRWAAAGQPSPYCHIACANVQKC